MDGAAIKRELEKGDLFLYRYRKLNLYTLDELKKSSLYFPSLKQFNDPFEASEMFGFPNNESLSKQAKIEANQSGYACFCRSGTNLHMWSHYGDGLRGICLVYDGSELYSSLLSNNRGIYSFNLLKVAYENKISNIEELIRNVGEESFSTLRKIDRAMRATKLKEFECEDEVRLVIDILSRDHIDESWDTERKFKEGSACDKGLTFSPNSLKKVIFGELTSSEDIEIIKEELDGRDIEFLVAKRNSLSTMEQSEFLKLVPYSNG